ncbi:efflux RND transporter permease subunit [Acinetobacter sp. MD2(2019)]|uniref:efflux RND transporter permease subunit n=1 Tax=Acinetobacter sp. MD2(2019) TaxID=2605273 RepID=UPI002D1EFF22|nr:efflux RND transporter permease subunit [Acinetobacter sp. MD2(2019)]MEB3754158.1 efflux RND transporter permease subunit [Acinetobacter sp. MD2(2019)]
MKSNMPLRSFNLSDWAIQHQQFMIFLMLMIMLAGGWAYQHLSRDEDPSFTIKTAVVSARWSGANNQDMVNLVTNRLEQKIQDLPDLDDVQSYTRSGQTTIFVNLRDDTPPNQVPLLWNKLRHQMDDVRVNLPQDVQGPMVNDEFDDTFGTIYGFVADRGFSNIQLQDKLDQIKQRLQSIPNMGKISVLGVQDSQIVLRFSPQKIASLGLDLENVVKAIQAQNSVVPIAPLRTRQDQMELQVSGAFKNEDDLKHLVLHIGSQFIALTDIANIAVERQSPPQPEFHVNGQPAMGLAIAMAKGGNILKFGEDVNQAMQQIQQQLPVGMDMVKVADQSQIVHSAVGEFLQVLLEALMIVIAVSFLSLGLRPGFVVAVAIPLVLALTFLGMYLTGIGLQRISLGALIIALGLLVDDAMITVETMVSELEKGQTLRIAATTAFKTTAFPMLTGTLVMICGFIPVGFAASSAGEYCYSMFVVILIALLSSWLVAILFSPLCGTWMMRKVQFSASSHQHNNWFYKSYAHILASALKHKMRAVLLSLALLIFALLGVTQLKGEFFPTSDRSELLVSLTLAQNATQQATKEQVQRLEHLLQGRTEIDHYSSYIGSGAVRFYLPMDVLLDNENIAQLVIVAKDFESRQKLQQWLQKTISQQFPQLITRISPLELGPPVGWPIKYRVTGENMNTVRAIASELAGQLSRQPESREVNMTSGEPQRQIHININQIQARAAGLSTEQITSQLATIFSGQLVTQLRQGTHLIDVVLKADAQSEQQPEILKQLKLTNATGEKIPLQQVAQIEWGMDDPIIWRRQRLPFIMVQSDIATNLNAETVSKKFANQVEKLRAHLPAGYSIEEKGSVAESEKGNASVFAILPITIVLMLILLFIQLQQFSKVIQAVVITPFGLIGVVMAMLPTATPMGFVALLGIIALSGMIIRNAVILISEIDRHLQQGVVLEQAIKMAALHRCRPILLTACAAILGMIPISRQVFWGPMAYAMIGGLVAATIFTLTLLPVLISIMNDFEKRFKRYLRLKR